MRKTLLSFVFVSFFAFLAAGCATVSRASVQQGNIITSAEVERLSERGTFRTKVIIVEVDATGTERVLSAPTLISREGEGATISVENDNEHIEVMVRIPEKDHYADGADISIKIEQNGKLVSAPRILVQVPN